MPVVAEVVPKVAPIWKSWFCSFRLSSELFGLQPGHRSELMVTEWEWPGSLMLWLCRPTGRSSVFDKAVPTVAPSVPPAFRPTRYRPRAATSSVQPTGQLGRLKNITAPGGTRPAPTGEVIESELALSAP